MERCTAFNHWMYRHHFIFNQRHGKNVTVQCKLCLPRINMLSTALISTSNLKKHLMRKHALEYRNGTSLEQPSVSGSSMSTQIKTEEPPEPKHHTLLFDVSPLRIGFIGAGNMAFGITQSIITSERVPPSDIIVSAPSKTNLPRFQERGVGVTHVNQEVVVKSQIIFLAVKPHLVPQVLEEVSHLITQYHLLVSMAAGVTVDTLEELLPAGSRVMRLMPNLPCVAMEGALLLAHGTRTAEEEESLMKTLLQPCGLVEVGPERWIDTHTGLSGSGVAFVYVFAEALAEGAVKMGMPTALARRIAAQTVLGAGVLLRDSGKPPSELRAEVSTPGGTTIHGLHALERGGVRAAVMDAVQAATERARQLAQR